MGVGGADGPVAMAKIPKADANGSLSDYQLLRKIGSGSYGAAFLVMHKVRVRVRARGAGERAPR